MAELEAEVFLLGIWKNIEELEECLNLKELNAFLSAIREKEHRANKFAGMLKGINIDEGAESPEDRFAEVQRRAEARLTGRSTEELTILDLGLDFESDEDE